MVSVCVLAYNHEGYISQCLESILSQKTNFIFEILIHDDASVDKTADIIREYEQKYPNIIKPIYQKENQYSKGVKVSFTHQFQRAKGRYIAMCEGDDYWIDPDKLQKQIDFMEQHADVSMTFHDALVIDDKGKIIETCTRYNESRFVPVEDMIYGGGLFCPTASLVFRTEYIQNSYPDFCLDCHVGDYPIQLYMASKGYIYYFNEQMAVYRKGSSDTSWTKTFEREPVSSAKVNKWLSEFRMLEGMDMLFDKKYPQIILNRQAEYFTKAILTPNRHEGTKLIEIFQSYVFRFPIKYKIKNWIIINAYFIFRIYSYIKRKINK